MKDSSLLFIGSKFNSDSFKFNDCFKSDVIFRR
jgi:hypothetical protein